MSFAHTVSHPALEKHWIKPRGLTLRPRDGHDLERMMHLARQMDWGRDWMISSDDGLYWPKSGAVKTESALEARPAPAHRSIDAVHHTPAGWFLRHSAGEDGPYTHVVIAAGLACQHLTPEWADTLVARAGHVIAFDAQSPEFRNLPDTAISGRASLAPAFDGARYAGSSFERGDKWSADKAAQDIINKLIATGIAPPARVSETWYGTRATTPDRLPVCGALTAFDAFKAHTAPLAFDAKRSLDEPPNADGRYLLTGLGSKGWQHAPLLADVIGALISNEPVPIPRPLLASLSPLRFEVRRTIKQGHRGPRT